MMVMMRTIGLASEIMPHLYLDFWLILYSVSFNQSFFRFLEGKLMMVCIVKAGTRLAPEALTHIGLADINEGVSRVFLVEGKVRALSVVVDMLPLRPLGSALPLEHLIEVPQGIEAAELEAQVIGAVGEIVADIGVGGHQVLLVVEAMGEGVPEVLMLLIVIEKLGCLRLVSVEGRLLATELGVI